MRSVIYYNCEGIFLRLDALTCRPGRPVGFEGKILNIQLGKTSCKSLGEFTAEEEETSTAEVNGIGLISTKV